MFDWIAGHVSVVSLARMVLLSTAMRLWLRHRLTASKSRFGIQFLSIWRYKPRLFVKGGVGVLNKC